MNEKGGGCLYTNAAVSVLCTEVWPLPSRLLERKSNRQAISSETKREKGNKMKENKEDLTIAAAGE